ncbi:MAG: glycosyltransferase [Ignavibacteria bacterium]|nr:glycosyltransferase [Ignavibacteria bacterium]
MGTLTLSMIVKNEAHRLGECLQSVKEIADEIVIVDTGSTDNTVKVAESYRAKIFFFDWIKDFSAARNFALRKSTGDLILYLDADEKLTPKSVKEIKRIKLKSESAGYNCKVTSLDSEFGRDNSMLYVRLFSNSNEIEFSGKVHEQILPSLIANNYKIIDTNIEILHTGYDISGDAKKDKARRNLELLLNEYSTNNSSYYAFQLGLTYQILENDIESKKYFDLALSDKRLSKNFRTRCHSSLAIIELKSHKVEAAEIKIKEALTENKDDAFSNFAASKIYLRKSDLSTSKQFLEKAIRLNNKIKSDKANSELIVFLNETEMYIQAVALAKIIIDKNYYITSCRKLIDSISNKDAANTLTKIVNNNALDDSEIIRFVHNADKNVFEISLLFLSDYNIIVTKDILIKLLSGKYPESIKLKTILAKHYTTISDTASAIQLYEELKEITTGDPSIYFYLISLYIAEGNLHKVKHIVLEVEAKFSHIPEVKSRVIILKEKLQKYL